MVRTWHHGLVARWWVEFTDGGDDVQSFRRGIEHSGEPVLDAACGTGRLLLPLARSGLDIDGSDVSADMLRWCQRQAEDEGLSIGFYQQPMHELDLPREYGTVIFCGSFGLGSTRADDLEGLRRIRRHLKPGGSLIMDHHLPFGDAVGWHSWVKEPELPGNWSPPDRRRAADGTELELSTRVTQFDPLEQTTQREIRVRHLTSDGSEIAVENHRIHINLYFQKEVELMLAAAGFQDVVVTGEQGSEAPVAWRDSRLFFQAS